VLRIGPEVRAGEAHGEFIGLAMLSTAGVRTLRAVHAELVAQRAEGLERSSITHILQAMIDRGHPVVAVDIHKGWMEIDSFDDYRRAWAEVAR
jgi:phosphoenolpyruvate phosphomutase